MVDVVRGDSIINNDFCRGLFTSAACIDLSATEPVPDGAKGQLCRRTHSKRDPTPLGNDTTLQGANGNDPGIASGSRSLGSFLVRDDDDCEGQEVTELP